MKRVRFFLLGFAVMLAGSTSTLKAANNNTDDDNTTRNKDGTKTDNGNNEIAYLLFASFGLLVLNYLMTPYAWGSSSSTKSSKRTDWTRNAVNDSKVYRERPPLLGTSGARGSSRQPVNPADRQSSGSGYNQKAPSTSPYNTGSRFGPPAGPPSRKGPR